jgi:hypothetical protein
MFNIQASLASSTRDAHAPERRRLPVRRQDVNGRACPVVGSSSAGFDDWALLQRMQGRRACLGPPFRSIYRVVPEMTSLVAALRAVTSISIFMRGSSKPADSMVAAGRTVPRY